VPLEIASYKGSLGAFRLLSSPSRVYNARYAIAREIAVVLSLSLS